MTFIVVRILSLRRHSDGRVFITSSSGRRRDRHAGRVFLPARKVSRLQDWPVEAAIIDGVHRLSLLLRNCSAVT
jgi:hypothetical protein